MRDFLYYRCSGSDGYRFGGERICSNAQVQGNLSETTVWCEVSKLLMNPQRVELEHRNRNQNGALLDNLETLRSQKAKLEHAVERLIDSFAEGLIEKDQFASRMARTKSRIADLETRIEVYAGDLDQREHLRLATNRLRELAATVGPELGSADWHRRREIIRTIIQRIDIDTGVIKIVFRVNQNTHGRIPTPSLSHSRGRQNDLDTLTDNSAVFEGLASELPDDWEPTFWVLDTVEDCFEDLKPY